MSTLRTRLTLSLALCALWTPMAAAQVKGPVVIDITSGRRDLYKLAVPPMLGTADAARTATDVVSFDLGICGWFKVLDPASFVANLPQEQLGIVPDAWRNVGAEGVSKGRATVSGNEVVLEFKLYELARGDSPVLQKTYRGPTSLVRNLAHAWSNEVVKHYTGEDGFFDTQIAFAGSSGPGRKDIYVMDYDGANVHRVTDNGSQNILPAWAPNGRQIAYTSFIRGNPDLYLLTIGGGRARRISDRPGVNMGAAFSPDGTKIACTLSKDGNSEIYVLSTDGSILQRLTDNPFIDSSPAWSPDGSQLAFVSNRHGTPQVWLMNANGGNAQRLTRQGNYNQEPAWCPKCQTPTIAFTARDERAHFDVFTIDVKSGALTRLTENQGEFEHPSWSPNGRVIAVASARGGVYLVPANGMIPPRQVFRGQASTPAWGPARH